MGEYIKIAPSAPPNVDGRGSNGPPWHPNDSNIMCQVAESMKTSSSPTIGRTGERNHTPTGRLPG
jgi:hypothetical protein